VKALLAAGILRGRSTPITEEDKAVVRPESQGIVSSEEEATDAAREKIHIPDYVMQDFGFPKKTRAGG
jgi:hypothetical protein